MSLLRRRISILLCLDLLCQLTEQKVLKSPGYIAKISLVTLYVPSVGNGDQPIFPFFFQSCPYLPFFPLACSSGSSLQLCYLRVIHPLFSLLSKSLHASWAANSKEVVAAQQSLWGAEQRH